MSVDVDQRTQDGITEDYSQYRALSVLAVASCVLGVLSLTAFLSWPLAVVPLLGVVTGIIALRRIRANAAEMTGQKFASAGIMMSVLFFCAGWGYLTFSYVTEVPPGYERLSYSQLQPDPEVQGQIYPPEIVEYDGHRVFIKGYVLQGKQQSGIKQFILCRDNGDCCFGGQPRLTDRIQVTLKPPLTLEYSTRLRRLAGTFYFAPAQDNYGLGGVIYHLEADYLK